MKAHGDAETAAEKIVLTDKDYRRLLYQEPGYQSALQSIFTMYSVIFVGCSLQDPELKLLLNYINAAFPEGGIPHYALMTHETTGVTERNRWRKDYNMQTISISADNNYEDINIFFKILRDEEDGRWGQVLFLVEIIRGRWFQSAASASCQSVSSFKSFCSAILSLGRLRKPLILRSRGSMSNSAVANQRER